MRRESNDPHTGTRQKINHDRSEGRETIIHQSDGIFFMGILHDTGCKRRQKYSSERVFEEISIGLRFRAVFQDQLLPNLHPGCLESLVKSRGILRWNHIRRKTRATCEDARRNRNGFHVPRYSMVNVVSADRDRNHNFLRFSIFPLGYTNFIKIKYQVSRTALEGFMHAAHRFFEEDSRDLQTRLFLWRPFLFLSANSAERREMNESTHPRQTSNLHTSR
jgi:hypothetical protein